MQSRILYAFSILFLVFIAVPVHAQWEAVTVPGDESIIRVERSSNFWYAQGSSNLYRSSDDGLSWKIIRSDIAPDDRMTCQEDTLFLLRFNGSLLRSNNSGISWDTLSGPYNLTLNSREIAIGSQYLFFCGLNKLYRLNKLIPSSEPELLHASGTTLSGLPLVAVSGSEVFFTINDSLLYSSDAGNTWSLLYKGYKATGIAYHGDTLVVTSAEKTYRSVDKGQSWEAFAQYSIYLNLSYADGYWKAYLGGAGINVISLNGGAEWQPLPGHIDFGYNYRRKGSLIIGGCGDGIFRSTDAGQNWEYRTGGLMIEEPISLAESVCETGGLLRANYCYSTDEGLTWVKPIINLYGKTSDPIEFKGNFFCIGVDNHIYRSSNLLRDWAQVSTQTITAPTQLISTMDRLFLVCINLESLDSMLLFESVNMGSNWQLTGGFKRSNVINLTAHNGYLYLIAQNSKLVRTLDGGKNWETVSTIPWSGAPFATYFTSLYGKLFIYSYSGYLVSVDNGLHFIKLNQVPPGINRSGLAFDGTYLISTLNNKVYLSEGLVGSNNWIDITENLPNLNFSHLDFAFHKGYIYLGDRYQPLVFRRKLSTFTSAQLSGEVYQDDNNNGIKDAGEAPLGGIYLKAGNGSYTTSKQDGTFSFNAYLDRDTIQALAPKNWMQVNPEKRFVQGNQGGLQFGIYTPPGIFDFSCRLTAFQPFRPGFQQQIALNWKQTGSASGTAVLSCVLSAPAQFLSASITPNQIKGDTLVWNLSNIQGGQSGTVILEVTIPANVPLGTPLRVTADIFPVNATDIYPPDNKSELNSEVVGAYDPNDKQCTPEYFSLQDLDIPPPLTYTIRFQNEGNFPAEFVRILDTLDYTHLDVSSLEVLATSHPCETRLEGNGIVEFFFGNIQLLPKSSDEAGSQGFVQYRIQPKRGLPVWVNINNRAHIFFDFNAPIVTNTTETGVQLPVRVRDAFDPVQRLKAWPNPSAGLVSVELPEIGGILSLFDAFGRLIEQRKATKITEQFDLSAYPAGLYRLFWMGDSGQRVRNTTLVKQ